MTLVLAIAWPVVHAGLAGLGLAAGAIPVIIHLIHRRRFRRVPWAAMQFLQAAQRRSARRVFIEQWLVLLLRVLAVVLIGLAIARPFVPATGVLAGVGARVHHVLLWDDSLSMAAVDAQGRSRFDQARAAALAWLEALPPRDPVTVLLTSSDPPALAAEVDRRRVRQWLTSAAASQRAGDVPAALARARQQLQDADTLAGNAAVYVLSDFAGLGGAPADGGGVTALRAGLAALAPRAAVTLLPVGEAGLANLAVTQLALESPLVVAGHPARLQVQVTNFSAQPTAGAELQLRRAQRIVHRQAVPTLAPGEAVDMPVTVGFDEPGCALLEARLQLAGPDALAADNARLLSVEVREALPVLIVDGQPGRTRLEGDAGYVLAALAPGQLAPELGGTGDLVAPRVIGELALAGEPVGDYAVVVLCNVERLPAAQWDQLSAFVRAGGGLLIFAGDRVDVGHYNEHLARSAAGGDWGVGRLGPPALPADAVTQIDPASLTHPVVQAFAQLGSSGLLSARFTQYFACTPDPGRAEVVIAYATGDPMLVWGPVQQGRVAVWTTSANLAWTNLPAKGDYVSLLHKLAGVLAPARGSARNLTVGGALYEVLSPAQSALPPLLSGPDGPVAGGRRVPAGEQLAYEFTPVESAGAYRLALGAEELVFAVNVDPRESDLTPPADLAGELSAGGGDVRVLPPGAGAAAVVAAPVASELAQGVMFVALILLLAEMLLALWFGSGRGEGVAPPRRAQPPASPVGRAR